jgi:4a-hydroxytetrahydrobiopterin dehydratase
MALVNQKCETLQAGTPPPSQEGAQEYLKETPAWALRERSIEREFHFNDFREAMASVNNVADLAEQEGHHPDIHIHYSKVRLELSTHKIGGLSKNDFVLAAKIDRLVQA